MHNNSNRLFFNGGFNDSRLICSDCICDFYLRKTFRDMFVANKCSFCGDPYQGTIGIGKILQLVEKRAAELGWYPCTSIKKGAIDIEYLLNSFLRIDYQNMELFNYIDNITIPLGYACKIDSANVLDWTSLKKTIKNEKIDNLNKLANTEYYNQFVDIMRQFGKNCTYKLKKGHKVYRGIATPSVVEVDLYDKFGPPLIEQTIDCRMTKKGDVAFYCADTLKTAQLELQKFEDAEFAEFVVIKDINIIDLSLFWEPNPFDNKALKLLQAGDKFITGFVKEISEP